MRQEREDSLPHKSSKCPYCGSRVTLLLKDILYDITDIGSRASIVNYINTILSLPSKNAIGGGTFRKHDHRCYESNNPFFVKEMRMTHSPVVEYNPTLTRVRYTPVNKHKGKMYLEDGILSCECTQTIALNPIIHSMVSYSDRIGYDHALTKIRHYLVNHLNRRP